MDEEKGEEHAKSTGRCFRLGAGDGRPQGAEQEHVHARAGGDRPQEAKQGRAHAWAGDDRPKLAKWGPAHASPSPTPPEAGHSRPQGNQQGRSRESPSPDAGHGRPQDDQKGQPLAEHPTGAEEEQTQEATARKAMKAPRILNSVSRYEGFLSIS